MVIRTGGGLRSRAEVEGFLLPQTMVEVRFRCGEGPEGS